MAIRWADVSDSGSPRISSLVSIPVRSTNASTSRWRISPSGRVMMLRDSSERESSRSCAVELGDPREDVVEAARGPLAMRLGDERIDLVAEQRHLGAEREDVLDRPVVEVEADPHQPLLAGARDDALALGRPLEEQLALVDRGHRRGGRLEVGVCARGGPGDAGQDRGARDPEPADDRRPEVATPEKGQAASAAEHGLRARPDAAALGSVPDGEHRLDDALLRPPQRHLARDAEPLEETELDLARDERR